MLILVLFILLTQKLKTPKSSHEQDNILVFFITFNALYLLLSVFVNTSWNDEFALLDQY